MIIGSGAIVLGATRTWDYVADFENVHCPAVPSAQERFRIGDSGKVKFTTWIPLIRVEVLRGRVAANLAVPSMFHTRISIDNLIVKYF